MIFDLVRHGWYVTVAVSVLVGVLGTMEGTARSWGDILLLVIVTGGLLSRVGNVRLRRTTTLLLVGMAVLVLVAVARQQLVMTTAVAMSIAGALTLGWAATRRRLAALYESAEYRALKEAWAPAAASNRLVIVYAPGHLAFSRQYMGFQALPDPPHRSRSPLRYPAHIPILPPGVRVLTAPRPSLDLGEAETADALAGTVRTVLARDPATRVLLVGFSLGAARVIHALTRLTVAETARLAGVLAIGGFADARDAIACRPPLVAHLAHWFYARHLLPGTAPYDVVGRLPSNATLTLVAGLADRTVPAASTKRLHGAIAVGADYITLPDAGHEFTYLNEANARALMSKLVPFYQRISANCRPDS